MLEIKFKTKKIEISFLILLLSALLIRFYYFPYDLPVSEDALSNFTYATAINFYGNLPMEWTPVNNGWPIFLSFWFSIINLDNTLQYMQLQKVISIILSSMVIIPVYFLCKKYFNKKIALIGVALIAFDPRLILNSVLGITEPIFILLTTSSLVLFLKYDRKMIMISFILVAFATIIRSEGIFLFATLIILFFIKYKISKEILKTLVPCLIIFILILNPILDYRMEVIGTDGIFQRASIGINQVVSMSDTSENTNEDSAIINGSALFIKYLGWILIPNFLIFLPFGIILFLKKRKTENNFIIIFLVVCSLPILYAYLRQAHDTRYLYTLFPIFSLISLYAVKTYLTKFTKKDIILFLMIIGIIISSISFYEYNKIDYGQEREYYEIAKNIPITIGGVNDHPTISKYIPSSELTEKWPFVYYDKTRQIKIIITNPHGNLVGQSEYTDLSTFIINNKNELTHLIVNDNSNLPKYLQEVYLNEEEYDYLDKIFDSKEMKNHHNIKLFKINYEKFNLIKK